MNRLLLYRNFEHEDLVYQMRTLAKKAQIDALTEDDLECYENCIHQMIEMAAAYGLQENLWHSVLACILANAENAFSKACEKKVFRREHYQSLFFQIFHFGKKCLQ